MTQLQAPNKDHQLEAAISDKTVSPLPIEFVDITELKPSSSNPRKHSRSQIQAIAKSVDEFGFNAPILIDGNRCIIAGHGRLEAARLLGISVVPTICLKHLSETQARAYMIADNKLTDRSSWDDAKLAVHLKELSEMALDFDIEAIGFETPEIDLRIQSLDLDNADNADDLPKSTGVPVTKIGDIWTLGSHRIYCGDALQPKSYAAFGDQKFPAIFTDPPYNVKIDGHVRVKGKEHREFAMASGEMDDQEFEQFLISILQKAFEQTQPSALIYVCMDWRHMHALLSAGRLNTLDLINLCVWVKTNGGMGSFYRSRHELVFVFRKGKTSHQNNVQLGRFGRNRTNVWNYPGANSFKRSDNIDDFESHPTVKPVRLVSDAILDCTKRGDSVLDPFLGSGTTLLAAERTGRHCFGIELDPFHIDTAIRRWERLTGKKATNVGGLTFAEVSSAQGGNNDAR